jgi:hypothetical protein
MTVWLLWALYDYEAGGDVLCGVFCQRLFAEIRQKQLEEERRALDEWSTNCCKRSAPTTARPKCKYPYCDGFRIEERTVEG